MPLDSVLRAEIVEFLTPIFTDVVNRRTLIIPAFYGSTIVDKIDWSGGGFPFTTELITDLYAFGGESTICKLLTHLTRSFEGEQLAELEDLIERLCPPQSTKSSKGEKVDTSVVGSSGVVGIQPESLFPIVRIVAIVLVGIIIVGGVIYALIRRDTDLVLRYNYLSFYIQNVSDESIRFSNMSFQSVDNRNRPESPRIQYSHWDENLPRSLAPEDCIGIVHSGNPNTIDYPNDCNGDNYGYWSLSAADVFYANAYQIVIYMNNEEVARCPVKENGNCNVWLPD